MEIVILLVLVVLASVPAGLVTTYAVIWHERRRGLGPGARPVRVGRSETAATSVR